MDEDEFKARLIKWDAESLDERVSRWKRLGPATYNVPLPSLLWEYLNEADDMFIRGHFIGVILLCAVIMELILADQLRTKTGISPKEMERFGLEQMVILSHHLNLLSEQEAVQINKLRQIRNAIIHANVGKLNRMAKRRYEAWGLTIPDLDAGMFLKPPWEGGIDQDALTHLQLTRDLTVRFYSRED